MGSLFSGSMREGTRQRGVGNGVVHTLEVAGKHLVLNDRSESSAVDCLASPWVVQQG